MHAVSLTELRPVTFVCRQFRCFWQEMRERSEGGLLPRRSLEDIEILAPILPYIMIAELLEEQLLLIRLAGSAYRDMYGVEITGKNMIELTPCAEARAGRAERAALLIRYRCGARFQTEVGYTSLAGDHWVNRFEALVFPVLPRLREVPQLMYATAPLDGNRRVNRLPAPVPIPKSLQWIDIGFGTPDAPAPGLEAPDVEQRAGFLRHCCR